MPKESKIYMEIKNRLLKESDEKYRQFSAALIPNIDNLLGVRIPILRKIAKEIYKTDWKTFINSKNTEYLEETMLKAMVIGLIKDTPDTILKYISDFIPQINNWSVCDSFCCSLKFTKSNKETVWNFLQKYAKSDKEYEIRFSHVMFLNYFIDENYLDSIFKLLNDFKSNEYYAQMGAAWLISICFIKYQNETMKFLQNTQIDNITYNKSIQKIIESYRVNKNTKDILRKMKR